jgi:hypothetical protein
VLGRQLRQDALDALFACVRHRQVRRLEEATLFDLGANAPRRPGLASLREREQQVIPAANRLEVAGLGRRHEGGFRPLDAIAAETVAAS